MSQSIISCINLIIESIETKKECSLIMMKNLISDLQQDHLIVEDISYDLLTKYSLVEFNAKYIYLNLSNAQFIKKIGEICLLIANKLNLIFNLKNFSLVNNEILILIRLIKNIVFKSTFSIINKDLNFANEVVKENEINIPFKKNIINSLIKIINNQEGYYPQFLEIIIVIKYLYNISKIGKKIANNSINILKNYKPII